MTAAERDERILSLAPVVDAATRARVYRLPIFVWSEDIRAAAWLGAIDAVDKFDAALNVPLRLYARRRVDGAIADYLRSLDYLSREQRNQVTRGEATEPQRLSLHVVKIRNDDPLDLSETIGDMRAARDHAGIEARLAVAALFKRSPAIEPRALRIVMCYAQGEEMNEIGAREGITESRVSQIRKATLLELRKAA